MIKILLGGSPCTYWSSAQTKNRETQPSGLGWELFENYLIAKDKFKPDFFLYENNKSASQAIKDEIKKCFGVGKTDARYIEINSALVSAQNRRRFYVHNCGDVGQPEDRGISLRDILESGNDLTGNDKAYTLTALYNGAAAWNTIERLVAEPVRIGTIENNAKNEWHDSRQYRVYSPYGKSTTLCGHGGGVGAKTGLYACPIKTLSDKEVDYLFRCEDRVNYEYIQNANNSKSKGVPYNVMFERADGKHTPIYEVKDGKITIKGKQYPIKLSDGFYIIRKLTVKECCRLQTLPDDYCRAVSKTQAYKGLGNGWTAEVIIHILNGALKDVPRDEKIVVLSMYDGIGTGRYCLDKMGFQNIRYYAYEIDKHAIQTAMSNYPDIIQYGDAFQVRNEGNITGEYTERAI